VLVSTASLRAHEDMLTWMARNRGRSGCTVAINAPLIVENIGGRRPCDEQLEEHFGRYQIDEYHVNTVNASHPRTMGKALMRMGFHPDPTAESDRVIETNNQAAQILLFDLERPIRMKSGVIGARKDAVARMRELIEEKLSEATPALQPSAALDDLLGVDLAQCNGTRIGELEEQLQALLTAWMAAYLDFRGPEDCAFLGDLHKGYILLPTSRSPQGLEDPA
jgi:predicted RNase H-like nuclease